METTSTFKWLCLSVGLNLKSTLLVFYHSSLEVKIVKVSKFQFDNLIIWSSNSYKRKPLYVMCIYFQLLKLGMEPLWNLVNISTSNNRLDKRKGSRILLKWVIIQYRCTLLCLAKFLLDSNNKIQKWYVPQKQKNNKKERTQYLPCAQIYSFYHLHIYIVGKHTYILPCIYTNVIPMYKHTCDQQNEKAKMANSHAERLAKYKLIKIKRPLK